ncbi:transporter substrate-binding domain-containing protein [Pseudomaricurvus alkylphenolicus]|uniref:transporter substrate-binding domain-containing protein n=1 Tax=Pseudomaricurvus alkylphenolicus TaxID=1306991 RepID=UPI0014213F42|nr:transporter substrate-binding domain-containing protein [Pseudomaricurvus alkylphenolicus]
MDSQRAGLGLVPLWLWLLCWPLVDAAAQQQAAHNLQINSINLVSEAWKDATRSDGTGLYWELFRLVYEPVGIRVNTQILPYDASVHHVQRGRSDAWLGSYMNEQRFAIYPEHHFDFDVVSAMFLESRLEGFDGLSSLANKKVAWIKGYTYDRYIDVPIRKVELRTRKSMLRMLHRGRIDFFLDDQFDMTATLAENREEAVGLVSRELLQLKLYPAFGSNARGRALRKLWDERMAEIKGGKSVRQLYQRWGFEYPFN